MNFNVTENSSKYYIEYIEYVALTDYTRDSHAIRYVYDLENKKNFTGKPYAKELDLDLSQDIFDYICENQ